MLNALIRAAISAAALAGPAAALADTYYISPYAPPDLVAPVVTNSSAMGTAWAPAPISIVPAAPVPPGAAMPEGPPAPVYPVMAVENVPVAQGVYTVQKGAHLSTVARRTRTALADLVRLNPHLKPEALLPAGTRVKLPIRGSW
ncbi:MAG: LysM domain-containing protein [Rhodospirillaceae bacterium]